MLKKILLALDGSENAEKAIPWAKLLGGQEHAQVVLLRVVLPNRGDPESRSRERQEAREYLQRMEKELNYAGIPAKTLVRRGTPAKEIVEVAREEACDLILMTTRGGSPVQRWMIGGVTEQVMRMSPIPVLPVRSQLATPRQGHVHRIIVPLDGSRLADSVVWWSIRMAQLLKAKLVFLHVYPDGSRGWDPTRFESLEARMTRICASLTKQGIPATFRLQRGDAAARIINFADRDDLILTTTHGSGGFKRWVFGSVAEKLIHDAGTPVLVYKAPA